MDANGEIEAAVAAAAAADRDCCDALSRVLSADPATTTVDQAQTIQQTAIADALREMQDTVPTNGTPGEVANWWNCSYSAGVAVLCQ